ncbi:envelope stress response protein PspG [Enterobacteriaceae bacterium RIT714]|jgi:phage shock protein G|uniref:envelope stress response protein PspG n=1 Tax=Lelliottia sp. CFBP8978 TaxID=3096522 RepID=UPI0012AD0192|nr:envelope stress response protein PspG [Lelliottia sp. CFBP8978]MDY1038516.1 envelope stress response protein PspG [Lelliottia sp. CFBP8978]MRS90322.1 envelope stress response protein PspG [Enterobacteriaceae bacterium RIT714]
MLELLFVVGFFVMLMATGISLLGILAALVVATAVMFIGGLFALMIKLLPWLLLAVAVVWVIRAIKTPKVPQYQRNNRFRY